MHSPTGHAVKHILRVIFGIFVFIFLVGLAKSDRQIWTYINFLNTHDGESFRWYNPVTWGQSFWPNKASDNISETLSWDTDDNSNSDLDVYDPAFEEDLNEFSDDTYSWTSEADYGFTTEAQGSATGNASGTDSQSTLLDLIKQRELTK